MTPYTAHQMGRDSLRQPIIGIFSANNIELTTLTTVQIAAMYHTLTQVLEAETLSDAKILVNQLLEGDNHE